MAEDIFIEALRKMLWISIMLSLPALGVALVVGIVIGLVQAITSIQEQTLSFVPKVAAIAVALALFGPWMTRTLVEYTAEVMNAMPRFGAL